MASAYHTDETRLTKIVVSQETVEILGFSVPQIEGGFAPGKRAVLAQTIAEIHGKKPMHVNEVIRRNRKRFKEGVDIIDLKPLKDIAIVLSDSQIITIEAWNASKHIWLFSQRGYLKLSKIFDDDLSWDIMEKLIDHYFHRHSQASVDNLTLLHLAMAYLNLNESSRILMLSKFGENHQLDTTFLPDYTEETLTKSLTEQLKTHGSKLSARKVNPLLVKLGILEIKTRPSSKGGSKEFYVLTEQKGLKYGKNLLSPFNQRETQPHYYTHNFPELLGMVEALLAF